MPDWKKLVRKRLSKLGLPFDAADDVFNELSVRLEATYEEAVSNGWTERAALKLALQEVEDWHVLATEIERARTEENSMNHRTRSLWLPALITLFGASVSLAATQFIGCQPRLVWFAGMGTTFYWPWLASLPVFGAAGAWLSRRASGKTPMRLTAGLAPALVMLIVMFLILPWGIFLDGFHFFRLVGFGVGLINWVGISAAALLLGALPFLSGNNLTAEINW
jgi:hypothetical protein